MITERARMLRCWVHSGFNVHRGRRVLSCERKDMERLAQYIICNPFSVEKMWATEPGPASASESIGRNFEVFTPCDFIAAITQHISDKSFQLVRYTGGIPTRCAAGGPSRRTKKCRPRATPWR